MRRPFIDFMRYRYWMLGFSLLLVVIGLVGLAVRGLNFGIEFRGGTVLIFENAAGVDTEALRNALDEQGLEGSRNANIQPTEGDGFIVRISEPDAEKASNAYQDVVAAVGLPAQEANVTTIGPGWGRVVTNAALLALFLSVVAILGVITVGFEYKMSLTAVVTLLHDAAIVLGVYAISGREVTPNTFAALLTILGYSLYDTIVVFHRIRENSKRIVKQSFMQMANESVNQVIVRSINTSLTTLIPVTTLLLFGGDTLQDFAFALLIGLIAGSYSSIAVAAPLYAIWKEREPRFQALKKKFGAA